VVFLGTSFERIKDDAAFERMMAWLFRRYWRKEEDS